MWISKLLNNGSIENNIFIYELSFATIYFTFHTNLTKYSYTIVKEYRIYLTQEVNHYDYGECEEGFGSTYINS